MKLIRAWGGSSGGAGTELRCVALRCGSRRYEEYLRVKWDGKGEMESGTTRAGGGGKRTHMEGLMGGVGAVGGIEWRKSAKRVWGGNTMGRSLLVETMRARYGDRDGAVTERAWGAVDIESW